MRWSAYADRHALIGMRWLVCAYWHTMLIGVCCRICWSALGLRMAYADQRMRGLMPGSRARVSSYSMGIVHGPMQVRCWSAYTDGALISIRWSAYADRHTQIDICVRSVYSDWLINMDRWIDAHQSKNPPRTLIKIRASIKAGSLEDWSVHWSKK